MDPHTGGDHTRKKRRVSRSASPSRNDQDTAIPPRKSLKFWFIDGNVVLKTQMMQYRIHRGVLSIQSSMFEDLFDMPQPEEGGQTLVEGCPVVSVTDSAEDWDALLGLLYNMERYIPNTHIYPLQTMLAMLRLGHKYDFAPFREEGLRQLQIIFPKNPLLRYRILAEPFPGLELIKGHEFQTLRAIEDLHIQSVLPLAYMTCITDRTLEEIVTGRDTPDGPVFLSQQTRNVLILGKQRLVTTYASTAYGWLCDGSPSAQCANTIGCKNEMLKLMARLLRDPTDLRLVDVLDRQVDIFVVSELCRTCQDEGSSAFQRGRRNVALVLPSYFGLPPWDRLKDFQA